MNYYTKDGNLVFFETTKDKLINSGSDGKVYHYGDNKCIKIYHNSQSKHFDEEIFALFKKLNLSGYCKLYDLLYSENSEISAHIMKYYHNSIDNILLMPTDYTLDNIASLFNSINILSANGIITRDMYYSNCIFCESEIIIIDFDKCSRELVPYMEHPTVEYSFKKEELRSININNLLCMFYDIYKKSLEKLKISTEDGTSGKEYLDILFSYTCNPPKELSKKLSRVKKPIDLLYQK